MEATAAATSRNPPAPAEDWLVRWHPAPGARLRLFCLPHSGAGAAVYRLWGKELGPDVEVVAVRLPGRESRFRERPLRSLEELVPALVRAVRPLLDRPHAWFGHSMGALVGYEVCRELHASGLAEPARLMVSGRRAPHLPTRSRPVHDAPLDEVVAYLEGLNGTPREVLEDPAALGMVLPTLRADLAVSETYRWRPGPRLDCPVSVFGGRADPVATVAELQAWQLHTTASCSVRMFDGDHFYLHDDPAPVLAAVSAELAPRSAVTP